MKDTNLEGTRTESEHPKQLQENDEGSGSSLSMDRRFELLKNQRRRIVLEYLKQHDGETRLDELADHVTAVENDKDVSSITSAERKRVYVGLYQFHLPKMADMGVVDYDQDRGNVRLTDRGRQLYHEHERQSKPERRWYLAYLGVAGAGIVGVLVSMVLWSTPVAVAWLAGVAVAVAVLALADAYDSGNSPL